MKAKFVFENAKGDLPSQPELEKIFNDEINTAHWVDIDDDGTITYATYPGSSLRGAITALFKSKGWDKYYNLKDMEMIPDDSHEYIIPPYKSEAERIAPKFDPNMDMPEDEDIAEQFIENFVEQALDDPEVWLRLEPEDLEAANAEDELTFVVEERIFEFMPLYSGEFLEDVWQEKHEYIIRKIADGLAEMIG